MSIAKWRTHIESYKSSGMSKAAYAKTHELDYNQFIYWCKKYDQHTQNRSDLIQVELPKANPEPPTKALGPIMGVMEYPNGVKLHIHHPDLLKALPDWRI